MCYPIGILSFIKTIFIYIFVITLSSYLLVVIIFQCVVQTSLQIYINFYQLELILELEDIINKKILLYIFGVLNKINTIYFKDFFYFERKHAYRTLYLNNLFKYRQEKLITDISWLTIHKYCISQNVRYKFSSTIVTEN